MLSIIFDRVQRLVKWVLPFYLFTFLPLSLFSQTLTGSAPSHVSVGEQFRLTYTINTQNVSDFRAGDIPEELEVLYAVQLSDEQRPHQLVIIHHLYLYRLRHEEWLFHHPSGSCRCRRKVDLF